MTIITGLKGLHNIMTGNRQTIRNLITHIERKIIITDSARLFKYNDKFYYQHPADNVIDLRILHRATLKMDNLDDLGNIGMNTSLSWGIIRN